MITIQCSSFILREWTEDDIPVLARKANNFKIWINLRDGFPHPYTVDHARAFIQMANEFNPAQIFAIEINGEASGAIGIHPQQDVYCKSAEIGYWLDEPHWGKGIATEAVKAMVGYAFLNFDIVRLFTGVYSSNPASMRVLEKAGFKAEGIFEKSVYKNEQFLNEHRYALLKKEL